MKIIQKLSITLMISLTIGFIGCVEDQIHNGTPPNRWAKSEIPTLPIQSTGLQIRRKTTSESLGYSKGIARSEADCSIKQLFFACVYAAI